MATIGSLVANLSLNSAPFMKGAGAARGALGGLGSGVMGLVGKFGPLAAALTGVAGVAGLGMLVKNSMTTIDSLAKTADAIGMTTESLAGLRRAGERSGVATAALDKGMARMQKTISTTAAAGGSKNFDKLGLSFEHLRSLSPEEQFFQIADAINGMEDQTDKTRLAMEMFGRDGVGMLKIVGRGAEAARNELAKAAELGLAPSREDAALVEEANDAIADMKDSFVGVGNTIAVLVSPMITKISGHVTQFGIFARQAFASVTPIVKQVWNVAESVFSLIGDAAHAAWSFIGDGAGATFGDVKDFLIDALIMAEFGFANWQRVGELAFTSVGLGAVALGNDIAHFFTGVLPALLQWFGENWREVFFTAFDLGTTVFINLGQNIRNMFSGLWNWIKSGFSSSFEIDWVPLTEGFHNAIRAMPEIPKRELGATEAALQAQVDQMKAGLSSDLGEFMTQRRGELLAAPVAAVPLGPTLDFDDDEGAGESGGKGESKESRENKTARGIDAGTSEAFDAIMKATSGGDLQAKTNQKLDRQTDVTREGFRRVEAAFLDSMKIRPKVASMRNGRPS